MTKYFNSNLKFIRTQKGISQQELADKLNIDRSTISRWENEEMDATVEKALQVADVLNIPYPDFLGKDLRMEENNNKFDEYAILFNKYKELSEEDKELIASIIETRKKQIDKESGED